MFSLWRYAIGHSQLLLRSAPDSSNPERLDLLFEGVSAVQLVSRYEGLELHTLDEAERERIIEMSGVPARLRPGQLVLGLRSGSKVGYVHCLKASAYLGGTSIMGPSGPSESIDVIWSLRR
ncbi:hypothetical protein [Streptomyces cinereoruber]